MHASVLLSMGKAIAVRAPTPDADDQALAAALMAATGRSDIAIIRRPSGRPSLAPPYAELGISIATRGSVRVAAFAPAARIGVDVECHDPSLDVMRLATDHFTAAEATWVAAWPAPQRSDAFLRLWCAKEAVLKITGRGVFDGVLEPDLSAIAAGLCIDGAVHDVDAAADRGPCHLAVRRIDEGILSLAVER